MLFIKGVFCKLCLRVCAVELKAVGCLFFDKSVQK